MIKKLAIHMVGSTSLMKPPKYAWVFVLGKTHVTISSKNVSSCRQALRELQKACGPAACEALRKSEVQHGMWN